jgi:hypothetical protein
MRCCLIGGGGFIRSHLALLLATSARLMEVSGWTPRVPFEAGIEETWNFLASA